MAMSMAIAIRVRISNPPPPATTKNSSFALLLFRSFGSRRTQNTESASAQPQDKHKHNNKLADRLASVIDAVNERKLPSELRNRPDAIRSQTDIINVVEQRIWRSMEEGEFDNLPGKGKPLKELSLSLSSNPHADPADDTLYRILSRNGCAPHWVELNKEIRCRIAEWRLALNKAWAARRSTTNHQPSTWPKNSHSLQAQMQDINNKVLHYNLIVPFGRQMCGLKWEKEIDKLD